MLEVSKIDIIDHERFLHIPDLLEGNIARNHLRLDMY